MRLVSSLLVWSLWSVGVAMSAVAGDAPPVVKPAAAVALTQAQAVALVAAGKQAMAEATDNPSRNVDAAVAFSQAIRYYEQSYDTEAVCDLEASIFWCQKRMKPDDVQRFLLLKKGDQGIKDALANADAVATKAVPKEQADEYLARAERFAKDHPDLLDQIAVRFFEVAERFVGTEVGIAAQKRSMAAQQQQVAALKATQAARRETLFTKPVARVAGTVAVPAPDAQKAAVASVRKLHKDDYAKRKPNQKRMLASRLLGQVDANKDDAAIQYALLSEAGDLAMEAGDFHLALLASDQMAAHFSGVDATALKKATLGRARAQPTAQALLTLLDQPEDVEANLVAGKYYCFEARQWELGLPLLAHAQDADFQSLAEMDLQKPTVAGQQVELADKWYELGKKSRVPNKDGMLARACTWYRVAVPTLTGITKERVEQRLDEIDALLPLTSLDFEKLTARQWDRLKGTMITIPADQERTDTKVRIAKGQRLRVVAHPTDTWSCDFGRGLIAATWRGDLRPSATFFPAHAEYAVSALVVQVDDGPSLKPGIIEGEGRLFLGPYCGRNAKAATGALRVKIMPVEED